jgi:hypothetical protein
LRPGASRCTSNRWAESPVLRTNAQRSPRPPPQHEEAAQLHQSAPAFAIRRKPPELLREEARLLEGSVHGVVLLLPGRVVPLPT